MAARVSPSDTSATRTSWARYREILFMLVLRDLQARSKQAYFGYLWIVIQPLLLTGVFTFLIQRVLNRSDLSSVPYPVFLLAALVPWQYCVNSLNESAESLVKNADLVRQVYFPREILAIYPLFTHLVDVAVGLVVLGIFMLVFHVGSSAWIWLVPLLLLVEMLFLAAIGMLLAAANVAWRDVARAIPLATALLIYAVPVLYTADRVPSSVRGLYLLDPFAQVIEAFRAVVLGTHAPDLGALALVALAGVVVFVVAQRIFSVFDGILADVI